MITRVDGRIIMFVLIAALSIFSLVSAEQVLCKPEALGMADGTIIDGQITASSYHEDSDEDQLEPWEARLNNDLYWRPDKSEFKNKKAWIQVDFLERVVITGIQTQGGEAGKERWIEKFQLQVGDDNTTMKIMDTDDGDVKNFTANINHNDPVNISFPISLSARYFRIIPIECEKICGLRFEVFGCRLVNECAEGEDTCHVDAECHDQDNGYQCTCRRGFTGNGVQCEAEATTLGITESSSNSTQIPESNLQQFSDITAGTISVSIILLIIIGSVVIVVLIRRRRKQTTSSETPSLDFDTHTYITVDETLNISQGLNVTQNGHIYFTVHRSQDTIQQMQPRFLPISNGHIKYLHSVYQRGNMQHPYAQVKSPERNAYSTQESWAENDTHTLELHDDSNKEPVVYAIIDEGDTIGGQNDDEKHWVDNTIYATFDDDKVSVDNEKTCDEGWTENTIYE